MKISSEKNVVVFIATILLLLSIQLNLLWEEMPNASAAANFSVVARIGKTMGADIYRFEPSLVVRNEKAQYALRNALRKHKVLVFHDVADKITPELQVKLTEVFGRVTPEVSGPPKYLFEGKHQSTHVKAAKLALSNVSSKVSDLTSTMRKVNTQVSKLTKIVTEPTDIISFGEGWHTDLTFLPSPPIVSVLVGRELPTVGLGNTKFLDARIAFDTLPETAKEVIMSKYANHTDGKGRWAVHPVVVPDYENSRHSLHVNRHFTREILKPSSQQVCTQGSFNHSRNTDTLLDELLDHIDSIEFLHPEAYLDISWSEGQMVIWEEKFTLHAAQKNYQTRREMHRTVAQ